MSRSQRRLTGAAPAPSEGFTSVQATARGLRIHIRQRPGPDPDAPVWVLLHGLAVSHRYLMPTAAALPGSVFVPDLPGFGLSGKPARVLTTEQHADVVAAWMDAAGLTAANVLGNSFGSQVAAELAIRRPDLVAALILTGPTVDPAAPTAGAQIRRWVHDLLIEDPQQIPTVLADFRDAGLRRVLGTLRHAVGHHLERRIPLIAAPILVLRGQYDPIASAAWIAQAASLARHGRTGEVAGAAHNAVTSAGPVLAARAVAFAATRDDRRLAIDHDTPAADARRLVEDVVHDWDMSDRADDVLLITTELVQNVTRHTDDGGELRLRRQDDAILIEVVDSDPRPPQLKQPGPAVPGGRGLLLVAAIARRWGSRPAAWAGRTGKIIWAEVTGRT